MATKSSNRSFLSGDQSAAKIRRDFIDKPLASAKVPLLGTGMELLDLMSILPNAFIASQERELARIRESGTENDDRTKVLEASIEQARALRTTVQRGEARVQRALGSLSDNSHAFHGFVSDADLNPLGKLTVRLTTRQTGKRGLTAVTDDDGYFRIPLSKKKGAGGKELRDQVRDTSFSQRLNNLFTQNPLASTVSANATGATSDPGEEAEVEILQKNNVVYTDPHTVPTDGGSVYREYVVNLEKSRSESDYYDSDEGTGHDSFSGVAQTGATKKASKKRASKK
jgi:hypothetical protein